jgi:fatty-acid desaturase
VQTVNSLSHIIGDQPFQTNDYGSMSTLLEQKN